MIELIKNKSNINESEINNIITRVKALIITSDNRILLKEETGLVFDTSNLEPFVVRNAYYKDYPKENINTKIIIYYFIIKDDRVPDLKNTNYTEEEIDGNFTLRYIPLNIVNEVLREKMDMSGDTNGITHEMLEVLDYFNKTYV